jgi:hypothetical protein
MQVMTGITDAALNVINLRKSAEWFPLDRRFRLASALYILNLAAKLDDDKWKAAAIPEGLHALQTDPSQADVIALVTLCELKLGRPEAPQHIAQFKHYAKQSHLMDDLK